MPPAAITGTRTASATWGTSTSVVSSSTPLWPPASNPSATTTSTPAASHLHARATLGATWTTTAPPSFRSAVNFFGLPADVITMPTRSSRQMATDSDAYL